MSLLRPKLCVVTEISFGLDIYQQHPTAGHVVFQPQHNALSATAPAIWHGSALRIDDARVYGRVLWNVHDERRLWLWLSIPIHSIVIYHRVEATIETGPIAQYYPNVVGPGCVCICVIIELHVGGYIKKWGKKWQKTKKFHEETIRVHILFFKNAHFLSPFFLSIFSESSILKIVVYSTEHWLWHLPHIRIQLVLV